MLINRQIKKILAGYSFNIIHSNRNIEIILTTSSKILYNGKYQSSRLNKVTIEGI